MPVALARYSKADPSHFCSIDQWTLPSAASFVVKKKKKPEVTVAVDFRSGSGHEPWRALVMLIPVRLGREALNPVYTPVLQTMLAHDMCLGIIGGKPKHSVYFVGWQGTVPSSSCVARLLILLEREQGTCKIGVDRLFRQRTCSA